MDAASIVKLVYILAAALFIFGLKGMGHPRTAVRGNLLGMLGMLLAIIASVFYIASEPKHDYLFIIIGAVIGSGVGIFFALKVQMTSMPQLVALFNGFGGAASIFVAGANLVQHPTNTSDVLIATAISGIIGSITFWGSLIACGKLQELSFMKRPFRIPAQQAINAGLALLTVLLAGVMVYTNSGWVYLPVVLVASVLGIMLVNPIGGADMPVVISLLNSYSGLAAAATGFVIDENRLTFIGEPGELVSFTATE